MAFVFKSQDVVVIIKVRDEHPPAHVHVESPKYSVEIDISGVVPKIVRRSKKRRVTTTEAFNRKALQLVTDNLQLCKDTWRQYHGDL